MNKPVLRHAAWLARRFGAELVLSQVVPAGDTGNDLALLARGEFPGIAVSSLLVHGDPALAIVKAAQLESADLIVVATDARWRTGTGWSAERNFQRFVLHAVVARIVENASCPVYAIPDGEDVPEQVAGAVLCVVETERQSAGLVALGAQFAKAFGADLVMLNAVPDMQTGVPGGSRYAKMWKESFTEAATGKITPLLRQAQVEAGMMIDSGDILPVLDKARVQAGAGLVVAGYWPLRDRHDVENRTFAIIRRSPVPVLVVPLAAIRQDMPAGEVWQPGPVWFRHALNAVMILLALVLVAGFWILLTSKISDQHQFCYTLATNCIPASKP